MREILLFRLDNVSLTTDMDILTTKKWSQMRSVQCILGKTGSLSTLTS